MIQGDLDLLPLLPFYGRALQRVGELNRALVHLQGALLGVIFLGVSIRGGARPHFCMFIMFAVEKPTNRKCGFFGPDLWILEPREANVSTWRFMSSKRICDSQILIFDGLNPYDFPMFSYLNLQLLVVPRMFIASQASHNQGLPRASSVSCARKKALRALASIPAAAAEAAPDFRYSNPKKTRLRMGPNSYKLVYNSI